MEGIHVLELAKRRLAIGLLSSSLVALDKLAQRRPIKAIIMATSLSMWHPSSIVKTYYSASTLSKNEILLHANMFVNAVKSNAWAVSCCTW